MNSDGLYSSVGSRAVRSRAPAADPAALPARQRDAHHRLV